MPASLTMISVERSTPVPSVLVITGLRHSLTIPVHILHSQRLNISFRFANVVFIIVSIIILLHFWYSYLTNPAFSTLPLEATSSSS